MSFRKGKDLELRVLVVDPEEHPESSTSGVSLGGGEWDSSQEDGPLESEPHQMRQAAAADRYRTDSAVITGPVSEGKNGSLT
jgi:hypothetical protein